MQELDCYIRQILKIGELLPVSIYPVKSCVVRIGYVIAFLNIAVGSLTDIKIAAFGITCS